MAPKIKWYTTEKDKPNGKAGFFAFELLPGFLNAQIEYIIK